jgi:hypothetical protein
VLFTYPYGRETRSLAAFNRKGGPDPATDSLRGSGGKFASSTTAPGADVEASLPDFGSHGRAYGLRYTQSLSDDLALRLVIEVPSSAECGIGTLEQVTGYIPIAIMRACVALSVSVLEEQNTFPVFSSRETEPFTQSSFKAGLEITWPMDQDVAVNAYPSRWPLQLPLRAASIIPVPVDRVFWRRCSRLRARVSRALRVLVLLPSHTPGARRMRFRFHSSISAES